MGHKAKGDSPGASLDSLLDTMTNVVGILVIVLVITQLGVGDAVDRITTGTQVSDAQIEAAQLAASQARQAREQLEAKLAELQAFDPSRESQKLDARIRLARAERDEYLKKKEWERTVNRRKLEEARKLANEYQEKQQKLQNEILATTDELEKLRAMLDRTPQRKVLPPKIINLPNPRPAPKGAKPLYFICREGKVYAWNRDQLRDRARKAAEHLVRARGLARDPKKGIEPGRLLPAFERLRLNDRFFLLKLRASGRQPRLVFQRKSNAGWSLKELQNPRGPYRQGIKTVDPKKYYLRFTVWPDSFPVYLAARRIASEHRIPAGWDLSASPSELEIPLGGPIQFGPPPPKPKTPPKPSKPPAKRKLPTREVPSDTID